MKFRPPSILLLLAALNGLACPPVFAAEAPAAPSPLPAAFRIHDRWDVIGDSITHSGTYHEWIELYYITRLPGAAIDVFNCGISGDRAAGGLQRLNWDILSHQPTVASIM